MNQQQKEWGQTYHKVRKPDRAQPENRFDLFRTSTALFRHFSKFVLCIGQKVHVEDFDSKYLFGRSKVWVEVQKRSNWCVTGFCGYFYTPEPGAPVSESGELTNSYRPMFYALRFALSHHLCKLAYHKNSDKNIDAVVVDFPEK